MFLKTKKLNRTAQRLIDQSTSFVIENLEARQLFSLPANPTGIAVTTATPSSLTLAWQDNSNNETGFAIERLINGNWATINGNLAANTQSYTDNGLAANTAYAYRVHAFNASGSSAFTFIGNAVTAPAVVTQTPPFAPYFLSAVANSSTQVSLSWFDNSGTETGVKVERKTGNGAYGVVATLAPHAQSYVDTTVSAGTAYTYRVAAFNTAGSSPYTNESAVNTPGVVVTPTAPAAPTLLQATASSTSQIGLAWTDNSNNETGFNVERLNGATWTVIASLPANTTSYNDTGLTANTAYTYRVDAVNAVGPSAYTNNSSATTQAVVVNPTVPAAPTALFARANSSSVINLTWSDNATNETSYNVERLTGATWNVIATLPANTVSYDNTGLTANTPYSFRVVAVNATGPSAYSNISTATTQQAVVGTPPYAPYFLSASINPSNQVSLVWYDNAGTETGVNVERKTGNGAYSVVATIAPYSHAYVDTTVASSTTYTYRVTAFNDSGSSPYTNESSIATPQGTGVTPTAPAAPTALQASAPSSTQINLSWADNSNNETGFNVERLNGATWTVLTTLTANTTSYSDINLTANTSYSYRVNAVNAVGPSAYTATATTTTQAGTVIQSPPFAPYFLSAVANSSTQISLSWYDNFGTETGVSVERQTANGPFTVVATLAPHAASFVDMTVAPNTTYTYRVASFNLGGSSPYTNISSATTPQGTGVMPGPTAPTLLSTTADSVSQITLNWIDNSNNETGFAIERLNGATWTPLITVAANTTSFSDGNLIQTTSYSYRVRAVNANGASAYTNISTATTKTLGIPDAPAAPTGLSVATVSNTQLSMLWIDNSNNETGFTVERQTGATWTAVATLPANTTFYIDGGLTPATAYSYRVKAINPGGSSAYTTVAGATTNATNTTGPRTDLTTFFPIGAFLQPTYTFSDWKARGVNTMVGFESYGDATSLEQWTQVANDRGLKYMREPLANPALDKTDPNLLAWLYTKDEPDLDNLATALPGVQSEFNLLRSIDPTRPIATTYAGGYMLNWIQGVRDQAYYQTLTQYTDWVMPCIYPVTGWNQPENISGVGKLVDRVSQWFPGKRNIAYIETSNQNLSWVGPQERGVTPDEFRGEVWDAVIHGATGVVYFPHSLSPFNYDATPADVAAEMTTQDARLSNYGAALLSTQNPAGTSISNNGTIETAWRVFNGKKYYFTLNLSANAVNNVSLATTGLAPSSTFAVDGETRNVTLQNTSIVDSFKPYEMHVYIA